MDHGSGDEKLRAQITSGFYFSDFPSPASTQMQVLEASQELFSLQSGIEMMGLPWKNTQQREKSSSASGFLPKPAGSNQASSSNAGADSSASPVDYYQKQEFSIGFPEAAGDQNLTWPENRLMAVNDDSSLRCVFPSEGQNHSLSLSLSPNKASNVQSDMRYISPNSEDFHFGKSMDLQLYNQQVLLDGRSYPSIAAPSQQIYQQQLKNSKYLLPTQELLTEFCCLKDDKNNSSGVGGRGSTGYSKNDFNKTNQSLYSLDFLELQKRNEKLVSMLEEVDQRYRKYCEQMRGVISYFDLVAGAGSASMYTSLASKAMSRHFRCLRDGIMGEIQATKKAMGEKDVVAPGTTRGETPRLKLLDQTLRQQMALQQMRMVESHPWRPQRGLPDRSVSVLRAWLFEHFLHPYPSDVDKHILARQTGLSRSQVSNWFINARVRLWKPMVEEMYLEETKERESKASGAPALKTKSPARDQNPNPNPRTNRDSQLDQKPMMEQLMRDDPGLLSSIVHGSDKEDHKAGNFSPGAENFGMIDFDLSNYSHAQASNAGDCTNLTFNTGVSLTLGLQQHSSSGVSLSFMPATVSPQSLFFSRQHMDEECPQIQYSVLDGTESQTLPYRNLMGAQLLHDLAG